MNTLLGKVSHLSRLSVNLFFFVSCLYKWDLVCDRRGKNKATATIFFFGVMFGAMSFGSLSDRYHSSTHRPINLNYNSSNFTIFQCCQIWRLWLFAGLVERSCCWFHMFLECSLLLQVLFPRPTWCLQCWGSSLGFASLGLSSSQQSLVIYFCSLSNILFHIMLCSPQGTEPNVQKAFSTFSLLSPCCFLAGVEWVDIEHRKLVGVLDSLSWTFGNISFPAIAYFVTDWRWLTVSVTSPLILAIITWRYVSKIQMIKSKWSLQQKPCSATPTAVVLCVRNAQWHRWNIGIGW